MPERNWHQARMKLIDQGSRCRRCRSRAGVECAHVMGREFDRYQPLRDEEDWLRPFDVHPDRIVPLCGRCHRAYDDHRLDLLPYLTLDEVLQAVADGSRRGGNGLENARIRITSHREVLAA